MARLYLFVALAAVIAAAVLLDMQYEARHQLRNQDDAMREQLKRLGELEVENARLSNIVVRFDTPLADEQLAELQDLRQQVALLRRGTNEIASLRTEIQRLRSALATVGNSIPTSPPEVPASDIHPRDSWTFAGYDTPENTIQSLMWAISQGDEDTYAAGLAPELQTQMQDDLGNGSFAADGPLEMTDVTGYRIVDRDIISDNVVTITVYMDGRNVVVPMVFGHEPSGDRWQILPVNSGP
jgi:hypothetical protein